MILCSCNVLTQKRIEAAAAELARTEPDRPVTPGRIFKRLGARPQCGSCFDLIRQVVREQGITVTCPEPLGSAGDLDADDEASPIRRERV